MLRLPIALIAALLIAAGFGTFAPSSDIRLPIVIGEGDTPVATGTTTATHTPTVTHTATGTPTSTGTMTPTPTTTSTGTATGTATATSTPTQTGTPTSTGTTTSTPTATSTATSTSTSTSTPTTTPTSTSTTVPGSVNVLDNHASFIDSIDYLHIVGEVTNSTGGRARFVKVTANLFNAQNQLVDTDFTYTKLDILPAGGTACFEILFLGNPSFAYYTFETSYSATTDTSLPIAVFGDSGSYNSTIDGWYDVVGVARNDSNVNAEFVKIIGTLYRSNGEVLDCDFTYTNAAVLTPGQQSTWKITFLHAPAGTVDSYSLQVQGRAQ